MLYDEVCEVADKLLVLFFHADVTDALDSAVRLDSERRDIVAVLVYLVAGELEQVEIERVEAGEVKVEFPLRGIGVVVISYLAVFGLDVTDEDAVKDIHPSVNPDGH